jgi:restriction system protein
MQFTMNENSLFAILLRSRWYLSFLIAAAMSGALYFVLPEAYRFAAVVSGLPFAVIGTMAAWRQWQLPSAKKIDKTTASVRAMSWAQFAAALGDGYRRDGYEVQPLETGAADFEIVKDWRRTLVAGKRWKVARTGVEPLRDLVKLKDKSQAHACAYVTIGEITDNAREFATRNGVSFVDGRELARLLAGSKTINKGARTGRDAGREQASSQ